MLQQVNNPIERGNVNYYGDYNEWINGMENQLRERERERERPEC